MGNDVDLAVNSLIRTELGKKIAVHIDKKNWTQCEAAAACGITQPRINNLLRGQGTKFSIDALVKIADSLGYRVELNLKAKRG